MKSTFGEFLENFNKRCETSYWNSPLFDMKMFVGVLCEGIRKCWWPVIGARGILVGKLTAKRNTNSNVKIDDSIEAIERLQCKVWIHSSRRNIQLLPTMCVKNDLIKKTKIQEEEL